MYVIVPSAIPVGRVEGVGDLDPDVDHLIYVEARGSWKRSTACGSFDISMGRNLSATWRPRRRSSAS